MQYGFIACNIWFVCCACQQSQKWYRTILHRYRQTNTSCVDTGYKPEKETYVNAIQFGETTYIKDTFSNFIEMIEMVAEGVFSKK